MKLFKLVYQGDCKAHLMAKTVEEAKAKAKSIFGDLLEDRGVSIIEGDVESADR